MTTPIIILVHPQMVENIGMTARAMGNCALKNLRIVKPRESWPLNNDLKKRMVASSSGADKILENAEIFENVEDAIADLNYIYATTARTNEMSSRIFTPKASAVDMNERINDNQKIGVLFGPERSGLTSDYVAMANAKITVPLNPEFSSLNLSQCVLLIAYEWFQLKDETPDNQIRMGKSRPANNKEFQNFFYRFNLALEEAGYYTSDDMRPSIMRNLKTMFGKAEMTEQEIRSFHGVIKALINGRGKKAIKKNN